MYMYMYVNMHVTCKLKAVSKIIIQQQLYLYHKYGGGNKVDTEGKRRKRVNNLLGPIQRDSTA